MNKSVRAVIVCMLLSLLATCVSFAQEPPEVLTAVGPTFVSKPVIPVITKAVKDLVPPKYDPNMYGWEAKRRENYDFIAPYYEGPLWQDPLVVVQQFAGPPSAKAFGTPTLNVSGLTSPSSPPDTTGDVGPNHFLQGINGTSTSPYSFGNSAVGVYNKSTGALITAFQMDSLATSSPCDSGYCDPIVLYDRMADRWVISEFPSSGGHFCVYVSTTPDPTGTWYFYYFANVESGTPDYPKYGVWPQNGNGGFYYVGVNAGSSGRDIIALDRANMLAGTPATWQKFTVASLPSFGFQLVLPATMEGNLAPPNGSPGILMRPRDDEAHDSASTSYDLMEMWALTVDFTTPTSSSLTQLSSLHISDYDCSMCGLSGSWNCLPQAGTSQQIDPIREPLHFPLIYRNFGDHEALVGCFVEDVDGTDHAALRWFEFRKSGGNWSVYQEGVVGGESGVHRSVGSITIDGSNNIAMGYTRTGSSLFPSICYTGRLSTDTLGTMPQGEHVIEAATTSKTDNERWGDYAGIGLDPSDDCTFWFTTEYGGSGQTKIAAFKFDACGFAGSVALNKDTYPCSGSVTITVSDASLIGNTTQNVDILSTRETTSETVVLTATPAGSATFVGTITLSTSAPVHGDGLLSIAAGNTITVNYIDANDGAGGTNILRQDTASVDCTGPTISNVAVTNITGTSATVTWTTNEAANSRVTYGTSTPPGTNADNLTSYVTSHSINLTGLTTCGTYYFSVTSVDAAGNSATDTNGGAYYTFTTPNVNQTVWSENFSGVTPTALPTGWTTINAGSGNNWVTNASGCTNNALMYPYSVSYAANAWAFTPGITLTSGITYTVSVNQKVYSASYPETFEIKCGSAASVAGQTITVLASASYTNTSCQALSGTFTVPTTGTYYLSFHCTSAANMWNLYVDDIVLSRPGSCTADLEYDSNTMTEACSGSGSGGGNGILEPGEDATLAITMENVGGAATGISATLSSLTTGVTVLTASANYPNIGAGATGTSLTNYVVHVDSSVTCVTTANFKLHSTSTQNPTGNDSYFTINVGQAGGAVTDFSQSFASVTPPALPTGWTESHTSGNAWVTTASYYCGAANGLYYPYNSSAAANSYVYTPGIALTSGVTYTLNFNQKVQSATYPENFEVKCGTAATPAGQTITILTSAQYTNTTCTLRSPTFTVPTTGTYYISWHCTSAADMYYLIIDDINLTHSSTATCNVCTPTCTTPSTPAIGAITDVSACAQSGINIPYTAGSPATSSVLVVDGSEGPALTGSPFFYNPGNSASHSYVMRTYNTSSCHADSAPSAFADANGMPGAITLTATNTADCGIMLTWTGGTGATQFNLYIDGSAGPTNITSGYVHTPGDSSSHSYVVRGVNGSCYVDSNSQALADPSCGAVVPGEVAAGTAFVWAGQVMSWTADSNATGYRVYRGLQANLANLLSSSTDFCTRYDQSTLTADVTADDPSGQTGRCYYYLITGYSGAGEGPAGNATAGARQVNTTGGCL